MAERIPEWAMKAAEKCYAGLMSAKLCYGTDEEVIGRVAAIIAQHAPPDVEAMLRELGIVAIRAPMEGINDLWWVAPHRGRSLEGANLGELLAEARRAMG